MILKELPMDLCNPVNLYNQFVSNSIEPCGRKWALLTCEMVLKDKSLDDAVHLRAVAFLLKLLSEDTKDFTDNEWIFAVDCTRKAVKRLKGRCDCSDIDELIRIIGENIHRVNATSHLLKLALTCRDFGVNMNDNFVQYLESLQLCHVLELDFDEFHFVTCRKSDHYHKQQCQRLLLRLDPLKCVNFSYDYVFHLFSISDSDLINFMRRLLKVDEVRFFKFYTHIIKNELLSVDFFIEQLLTDSVELLELLLAMSRVKEVKTSRHLKNFHTLLLLKLETSSNSFPFATELLLKRLENFRNKL